ETPATHRSKTAGCRMKKRSAELGAALILEILKPKPDITVIAEMIAQGADVNHRDTTGCIALHSAAYWRQEEIIRLLLDNGAKIDRRKTDGRTALMTAAEWGYNRLVVLLLEHGANPGLRDER